MCAKVDTETLYGLFRSHPQVTTDSRSTPQGSLFFALRGERFDGNSFALTALEGGAAYAVVSDEAVARADERCLLVDDTLAALQALAAHHRRQLRQKTVIQITGTNGKTTTKELIAAVLATSAPVQYTRGNLNNHIGVPLTLLTLTDDQGFAVIETGANHPGEIAALSRIVDPDYGLITNVGRAHLGGFGSIEGVAKAKGELYDYLRQGHKRGVFLNLSAPRLAPMAHGLVTFTYGLADQRQAEVRGGVTSADPYIRFRYRTNAIPWQEVSTQLVGDYNIHNLLAAVRVGLRFRVDVDHINASLASYSPQASRSQLLQTGRNSLILDAYNANPTSMEAALRSFSRLSAPRKMLILGDMLELGEGSPAEHRRIAQLAADFPEVWLVGPEFARAALPGMRCFASTSELREATQAVEGRTILVKGSNGMGLQALSELL